MDFKNVVSPRGFLSVGGVVLLVVGILGFVPGIIGPTADQSIFGNFWWFDFPENVAHTVLGLVALAAVFTLKDEAMLKWLTALVGALGIIFGVINLSETQVLGANLESPADTILHLVVGAWGLLSAFKPMKQA